MAFQDGDLIAFDYDLYVEGREQPFDTTMRATAEKFGAADPNAFYAPLHYLIGSGRLIKGLEEELRKLGVGQTTVLEIPVEGAYGPRDPKLIETIPIHEFRKNKVDPEVGLRITFKNRRGTVTYVGGGRIRVDFNHELAGKALRYVLTIRSQAKTVEEKVRFVIQMDFPTSLTWDVEAKGAVATIHVPEALRFEQAWLMAKVRIASDLRRVPELESVRFVESFPLKEPKPVVA